MISHEHTYIVSSSHSHSTPADISDATTLKLSAVTDLPRSILERETLLNFWPRVHCHAPACVQDPETFPEWQGLLSLSPSVEFSYKAFSAAILGSVAGQVPIVQFLSRSDSQRYSSCGVI